VEVGARGVTGRTDPADLEACADLLAEADFDTR
jgi:hypothetical protein